MKTTVMTIRVKLTTAGGVTAPEAQSFDAVRERDGTRVRNLLPVRRDSAGVPYLPGSTVAGSLRAHCHTLGVLPGAFGGEPGADTRVASSVQVLGTALRTLTEPVERTRTSMDRHRGAPAERTLHTVEQLPPGTEFDITLRWDRAADAELAGFRAAVASWAPVLGRGSSLGAGRCAVIGYGERAYDLATAEGLMGWLAITGPADYPEPTGLDSAVAAPRQLRSVRFEIADALHIGSGTIDRGPDGHHVARIIQSAGGYLVPGSTLKGVLRARAEYICRVSGGHACPGSARPTCEVGAPCRTCRLFGRGAGASLEGSRRAAIAIPDAMVDDAVREQRQHVAIDRFTGGARDALLYTHEVLVRGRFTVVIEELGSGVDEVDLALLDAVLADLHDGLVGLGARTTAGYGTVRVVDDHWQVPDLTGLAEQLRDKAEVARHG